MSVPFDAARASVTVDADTETAFHIFTTETGLWWRRGVRFRVAGREPGEVAFEPRVGGRLLETFATPQGERTVELGRVTAWEPPKRFCFDWRAVNFAADEKTFVEVTFEAVGAKTLVRVTHSGWAALRADHPVRHGNPGEVFIRTMGLWWGDQLTSLREHAAK